MRSFSGVPEGRLRFRDGSVPHAGCKILRLARVLCSQSLAHHDQPISGREQAFPCRIAADEVALSIEDGSRSRHDVKRPAQVGQVPLE